MTSAVLAPDRPALARRSDRGGGRPLTRGAALGLGMAMLWFSLLVLIPLAAVVVTAADGGWSHFWDSVPGWRLSPPVTFFTSTSFNSPNPTDCCFAW